MVERSRSSHRAHTPVRIGIADDHPLYREALRRLLEKHSDFEVVGEGKDGREALELCQRLRPEVILMDARMPEMDGVEATRAIKRELPDTIVLVITAFEDPIYLSEALKAGAGGYILKSSGCREIIDAICKAVKGEVPLDQGISAHLLHKLLLHDEAAATRLFEEPQREPLLEEGLPPREVEVLRLMARGRTNQQIAKSLLISASTVKKHVRHIISKLEVSDRTQAAVKAIQLGLLHEQDG